MRAGARVICNVNPFSIRVIPAKAGIQWFGEAFSKVWAMDSRLRGNDLDWGDDVSQSTSPLRVCRSAIVGMAIGLLCPRALKTRMNTGGGLDNGFMMEFPLGA
jgi:hypothetical protein